MTNCYYKYTPDDEGSNIKRGLLNEFMLQASSEVRMYETHIPGFCYKRNGETRIPTQTNLNQSVDFDVQIHKFF